MIQVYNTLSRKKEPFTPIEEGKIRMYLCGPTVYNYIHIGNARSAVSFDTIRRYFEYRGYAVNYISNFTDVDDKIINAAKALEVDAPEVAEKFINAFFEDTESLAVQKADQHPLVTETIPEIIDLVETLIEKDFAYESGGDVYYRTKKFEDYGKLSGITLEELQMGASERLEEEATDKKEEPIDFALWKRAKEDEMSWDSPWGEGRPGWHIECSAMSKKYLGETIDIHAGGQDLQFPHHENEIAQSEAASGKTFANYWMHNGFVTMGDEKMSKSLGNVKLVRDLRKVYDPQVIRFFLATAHYRRPLTYSETALEDAKANVNQIQTAINNGYHRLETAIDSLENEDKMIAAFQKHIDRFIEAMDDDFQAQNGITVVYEMIRELNRAIEREEVSKRVLAFMLNTLTEILAIFGLENLQPADDLLDDEVDQLIQEREEARAAKDFKRADAIRDELKEQGIILEDTNQGIRWKRAEQ
jgi:cysteinyl-tRNA synthetase